LKLIAAILAQSKNKSKIISLAFNRSAQTSIGDRHSLVPCADLMASHKSDIGRCRAIVSILHSSFIQKSESMQCILSSSPFRAFCLSGGGQRFKNGIAGANSALDKN
jgi:hypothetical protein